MVSVKNLRRRTARSNTPAHQTPIQRESEASPPPNVSNPSSSAGIPPFDFTDTFNSPFNLTNGDNPGNMIISEVLDGTNYSSWKIAMSIALDAKNKIAFVDGTLPRPSEIHPSFRIWSRCNSMVKSWLLSSVTKDIYRSILRFNDASEIWKDLMQRFHITNLPRSYSLTQQIWSLQQGSMNLSEYYTALKTLWDDLEGANCVNTCHNCKCCKAIDTKAEHSKIIKFLAGLNDSYSTIRSNIIMKKTVPELGEIYNLLDQEHSQRNIGSNSSLATASAFNMTTQEQFSVNVSAHSYNNNPKQNKVICSHCGYTGHTIDKCYKIHGFPPGFKHKSKTPNNQDKSSQVSKPVVASLSISEKDNITGKSLKSKDISELIGGMTKDQMQDVIAYFSTQLQTSSDRSTIVASTSTSGINDSAPNGSYQGIEDWTG